MIGLNLFQAMDGVQGFFTAKDVVGSNNFISMDMFAPFFNLDMKKVTPEQVSGLPQQTICAENNNCTLQHCVLQYYCTS